MWRAGNAVPEAHGEESCAFEAAMFCLLEGPRLKQTVFGEGQKNHLSDADDGLSVESTPTASVNKKLNPVQMYLRSCEIYAKESVVAHAQIASIGDETRANKKLNPVEMYWRSREIYKNECIAADTKNTPVVDVSVEDQLDDSKESDEGMGSGP